MNTFVIDTNVVVSAFLSTNGSPHLLMSKMGENFTAVYDNRIICEYLEVLSRPRFRLTEECVNIFLVDLMGADPIEPVHISAELPDIDDKIFIEAALATQDKIIVTGNAKHYPKPLMKKLGITVLSPAEALEFL